jgi:manganese/zinc/iron transport system permease protein
VIGLQSVGLLLVVALLIVPAAAARFWTHRLGRMTIASAVLGGLSAYCGVLVSALFPRLAAGAVIVLAGAAFFVVSLLFGTKRGVLWRLVMTRRLRKKIGRQHVLRAMYESLESAVDPGTHLAREQLTQTTVSFGQLLAMRAWSPHELERGLAIAQRDGLIRSEPGNQFRLTEQGATDAGRIVRNHRLWELYLLKYADVAPAQVDREADAIEHVLDPELVAELEGMLSKRYRKPDVPPSPHTIATAAAH